MIKKTDKNKSFTSFHGSTITTTPQKLIDFLGRPTYDDNGCGDKTNLEWECECNGKVVTIYDWKEYRELEMDEKVTWHIGGFTMSDTEMAKRELQANI